MTEVREVPDQGVFAAPTCRNCRVQFHSEPQYPVSWNQRCSCLFELTGASVRSFRDGRERATAYLEPNLVNKAKQTYCLLCQMVLPVGSSAAYGHFGTAGYFGYAHLECAAQDQQQLRARLDEQRLAATGAHVTVWFSVDDEIKAAPNTGHRDNNEGRWLPASLPELPTGSVVYQDLNRPFAMCRIEVLDLDAAEQWWQAAIGVKAAPYELYWFDDPKQKATRSWTGEGFGPVINRAQMAEWNAENNYAW